MPPDRPKYVVQRAMNYLLDTNHWSHLQRNHPAVVARVRDLPDSANLYMPVIAQGELLAGIELMPAGAQAATRGLV